MRTLIKEYNTYIKLINAKMILEFLITFINIITCSYKDKEFHNLIADGEKRISA